MNQWGRPDWDHDGYNRIPRHLYAIEYDRMLQNSNESDRDREDRDWDQEDRDWDRDR